MLNEDNFDHIFAHIHRYCPQQTTNLLYMVKNVVKQDNNNAQLSPFYHPS